MPAYFRRHTAETGNHCGRSSTTKRNMIYKAATIPMGSEKRPRFHFAGLKLLRPTVCLATIGMR